MTSTDLGTERELTAFEKAVLEQFTPQEEESGEQETQQSEEDGTEEVPDGEGSEGDTEGEDGQQEQEEEQQVEETQAEDQTEVWDFNGRELEESYLREAIELRDYYASLPEEAITAVNALLSGNYVLVHRDEVGQLQQPQQQNGQQQSPPVQVSDDEEPIDPQAHQRLQELESRLNQQDENLRQQEREAAERYQEEQKQLLRIGRDSFAKKRSGLSQDEIQGLWATVAKTGTLTQHLVAEHGGDLSAAMESALETAYWSNETYREREIREAREAEVEATKERRKRRSGSSALAGRGSSAPRTAGTDTRTRNEKIAAELDAHMNGGQQ